MSAGADQGEGVVVVDGVKEEPVGYDMQFTVVREAACELVVAVLFEPVGAALGNGLDCGFECVHVVVLVFEPLHVAQEGWPVGDRAFMHGWWG